jgi:hypothetical protein
VLLLEMVVLGLRPLLQARLLPVVVAVAAACMEALCILAAQADRAAVALAVRVVLLPLLGLLGQLILVAVAVVVGLTTL